MRSSHLDKILGRLEDLDSTNLTILVQRLARERALLETVFDVIKEGIVVVDKSSLVSYANAAAIKLLGMHEKDIGQAELWKFVPDLKKLLWKEFSTQKIIGALTRELEISYPEKRYLRVYIVPFDTEDTLQALQHHFALIFTDITEDKVSHEAYVESEKISSIFMLAAGVAHELGNPLNSINIHLQLMKRQVETLKKNEKIEHSLKVCMDEVQRLDGIIKNFLEAIRPRVPNLEPIHLLEIIQEVLNVTQQELEDLNVIVELVMDTPLQMIQGDKNQLKQVFFNIIRNASEAMDSGGKLTITTRMDDEHLYVYCADTGCGIQTQDISKVFEPHASTKTGGHGLGMMIVQRIMRDHGGFLGVESQEGVGTVVMLQFPLGIKKPRLLV